MKIVYLVVYEDGVYDVSSCWRTLRRSGVRPPSADRSLTRMARCMAPPTSTRACSASAGLSTEALLH